MSEKNTILDNDAFLGKGWSFPPTLTEDGVDMVAYEQDIEQSLYVLLSTSPGERVNRYDYGCPLRKYTFEVMDTEIVTQMRMTSQGQLCFLNRVSRWRKFLLKKRRRKECYW